MKRHIVDLLAYGDVKVKKKSPTVSLAITYAPEARRSVREIRSAIARLKQCKALGTIAVLKWVLKETDVI